MRATPFAAISCLCLALLVACPLAADSGRAHSHAGTPAKGVDEAVDAAALYHDNCSVCHGDGGDANSRARGSMVPAPRDFTAPAARNLSRARMITSVTEGRPGTAMAPWKEQLSHAQIAAIVDYIRDRFMVPAEQAKGQRGARIYARTCSVCHGDEGGGAVWAATNLSPRPRDFTSPQAAAELSRERMIHSVTFGRADTAMPGFGTQLERADVEAVVDYVRTAFMIASEARPQASAKPAGALRHGHDHGAHLAAAGHGVSEDPLPGGLVGDLGRGETYYRQNCVACHGEQGNGRGPRAYFILPKPRNFTHPAARSSLNRPHLYQAISRGSVGTEMPAWDTVLSPQAIADVSEYVFRRFISGEAATD